jgi:hypothetical protein
LLPQAARRIPEWNIHCFTGSSLSLYNAAAPEHGLRIGLWWFIPGMALEAADAAATPMPLVSLIRDHFLSAIAHGQGEIDWAGLARVIAENAGLDQPKAMPHPMAH